ncbi:MAG TPA: sugar phosphate isomerase/epimerase family protein [Planctomycetota bacterium]|nr:sugar phosphate isomerase/epimerase family protein [Planctomycetota bacterium]
MRTDRRGFLVGGAALAGAAALPAHAAPAKAAGPRYKLSLAAYSMRQYLDLKNPKMKLEEFIEKCVEWGCDGTELTEYFFQKPITPEYLQRIKRTAIKAGLPITCTPIGNTFTLPPGDARDKQLAAMKSWIDVSAELGSPAIRIFAGGTPKGVDEAEARKWAIECIKISLDHAAKRGVFLALENHGGIVATAEGMIAILEAVKHDWFGVNLDSGNFHTPDPYGDLEKIAPYAVTCQLKCEVTPKGGKKQDADYARVIEIMRKVKYRGFITLEYEAAEEPLTGIPKHLEAIRKLLG